MSSQVKFPSENAKGDGSGVLVGDPAQSKKGLIVLHEWWGVNEQIQQTASQIAQDGGFVVLVTDLYRGLVALDREHAGHYMSDLDWPGAVKDIRGAAKYLLSIGCRKVGVTGFCLGGALTFASAALVPEISAAAPFYGIPKAHIVDLTKITIPVQAHFGQKDHIVGFSSPQDYEPLQGKLLAAGVPLELHTYDAGHGFVSFESEHYNKDVSKLALSRMYIFMQKLLE